MLNKDYLNLRWQMEKMRPTPSAAPHAPQDCATHVAPVGDFEKCATCFRVIASEQPDYNSS